MAGEAWGAVLLLPGGLVPVIRLERSSGDRQLDKAALTIIEQAAQLATPREEWRRHRVWISLPGQFSLGS